MGGACFCPPHPQSQDPLPQQHRKALNSGSIVKAEIQDLYLFSNPYNYGQKFLLLILKIFMPPVKGSKIEAKSVTTFENVAFNFSVP